VGLWAIYYCVGSGSGISHFVEDEFGRLVLDFSKVMLWNGVGGERVGFTWEKHGVVVPMGARCRYETVGHTWEENGVVVMKLFSTALDFSLVISVTCRRLALLLLDGAL
jgi:hypothetical protein